MDLKLPVKITDSEGKIKKVLLNKSLNFVKESGTITFYLKFPFIDNSTGAEYPSVILNFRVKKGMPNSLTGGTSYFKATIYRQDVEFLPEIDISLNHGMLVFYGRAVVYYTDGDGVNHYYLKLTFVNSSSNVYMDVNYFDMSTNDNIPADFSYDNMLLTVLPSTEYSYPEYNFSFKSVTMDQMRLSPTGNRQPVITNSNSDNPGVTHKHLYPDTSGSWSSTKIQIGTSDFYMWTYSGTD
jgi:hypothetical protein